MDRYLTVRETIAMYLTFYAHPRPVDEVIQLVGLEEKSTVRVSKLSGGQQRRLDVAIALVANPELLFLDEPTTWFDPSARHDAWEVIKSLATLGMTVVLTTHYRDEVQCRRAREGGERSRAPSRSRRQQAGMAVIRSRNARRVRLIGAGRPDFCCDCYGAKLSLTLWDQSISKARSNQLAQNAHRPHRSRRGRDRGSVDARAHHSRRVR
jgi:hypothetical protein